MIGTAKVGNPSTLSVQRSDAQSTVASARTGSRLRVAHVIADLSIGGAETMLLKVCEATRATHEHIVVTLLEAGALADKVRQAGATIVPLGLPRSWRAMGGLLALRRTLVGLRPDVVQSWMYHANLASSVLPSLGAPVVWGIRYTPAGLGKETALTRSTILATVALSRRPDRIVYNAEAGRKQHETYGYPSSKGSVIPNGFDLQRYRPDQEERARIRKSLGLSEDDLLIGRVARDHPMKDTGTLLAAAARLKAAGRTFRLVLVGTGMVTHNPDLLRQLRAHGLLETTLLLGARSDVPAVTASLDLAVSSSSHGEAFPNVIGEAMACAVPIIATDVGDSAKILADSTRIVPPGDAAALAAAMDAVLALPRDERRRLGERDRLSIQTRFDITDVGHAFGALWSEVARDFGRNNAVTKFAGGEG